MATKLKSDAAKSKSGHFKAFIYLSVAEKSQKIVKNRQNGKIFAKYPTLTPKKWAKMNFRVIVAMLHPKSTTSRRDTEKIRKFVGGTKATRKIVHILLRSLKIPRVHDFSHFLRKNVEIFLYSCLRHSKPQIPRNFYQH